MKQYKAILFDFDYTLADSSEGIIISMNYALEKLDLPTASDRTIRDLIGLTLPNTFAHFSKNKALVPDFIRYFRMKADEVMVDSTNLYFGVFDLLDLMDNQGIKLGIVSTKRSKTIRKILEKQGIANRFEVIIGGEDVKKQKPSPEPLIKAMKALGSNGKNTLYVGDSRVDAQAAQRIRVDFIGVLSGKTPRTTLEQYENLEIVKNLQEVIEYFAIEIV